MERNIARLLGIMITVGIAGASHRVQAQPPPPLVGYVSFDDAPAGTGIAKDRYRSQGIYLDCSPGHWLMLVETAGSGRSLAISPGGSGLYIGVQFVVPGSNVPGAVQRTDFFAVDSGSGGYRYDYFDMYGNSANWGTNHGNYHIGDGWYYTDGPVAHRFVLQVGDGRQVFLGEVRFSAIAGNNSLATVASTWSAVRLLYR